MATNPATEKQLEFLKQLTGKDYGDEELTASEASKLIEKALGDKGKEVAKLPAQSKNEMLPEHERIIEEALKKEPAPQAVGMITKELGDMIRAGTLTQIFGKKIGIELLKWYRSQTLGITRIAYDGKDLPQYKED